MWHDNSIKLNETKYNKKTLETSLCISFFLKNKNVLKNRKNNPERLIKKKNKCLLSIKLCF